MEGMLIILLLFLLRLLVPLTLTLLVGELLRRPQIP